MNRKIHVCEMCLCCSTCTDGKLQCGESKCDVAVSCPNNQVYREDLPACGRTCVDANRVDVCKEKKRFKGCGCVDGLFLNEKVSSISLCKKVLDTLKGNIAVASCKSMSIFDV